MFFSKIHINCEESRTRQLQNLIESLKNTIDKKKNIFKIETYLYFNLIIMSNFIEGASNEEILNKK